MLIILGAGDMGKLIDITGQRFGFWVAIKLGEKNKNNKTQWLCQCECGNKKLVTSNSLRTGNSTSCGCNHVPNLVNEKFGKLTVLNLDTSKKSKGRRYWVVKCVCGKQMSITTNQLKNSSSCDVCKVDAVHPEFKQDVALRAAIAAITIIQKSEYKTKLEMMAVVDTMAETVTSILNNYSLT